MLKRNLLSVAAFFLISLSFGASAMEKSDEDSSDTNSLESSPKPSASFKKRPKNKEKYKLCEKRFSNSEHIDFECLYTHLHYRFKKPTLLVDALFPLIPVRLRSDKLEYEKLEFLGDSVLSLVIRERILGLLPDENRGNHSKLYDSLTQNRMLATVFMRNLELERYLPFPGELNCQYCNVVESLIGAIYTDAGKKGLTEAKKFIMRVLDDHVLMQNWQVISESGKRSTSQPRVLPQLDKIINDLIADHTVDQNNGKSFLGMILGKMFDDEPEYVFHLGLSKSGVPVFISRVIGAQIGSIEGCGFTRYEAEQDAAKKAINFLAKKEIYPEINIVGTQSYIKFINEYSHSEYKCPPKEKEIPSEIFSMFLIQLTVGDIEGEGSAPSKVQAREAAARSVFEQLLIQREEALKVMEERSLSAKSVRSESVKVASRDSNASAPKARSKSNKKANSSKPSLDMPPQAQQGPDTPLVQAKVKSTKKAQPKGKDPSKL